MRIAVVGSGISGLGCAWALSKAHSVVLLEKSQSLGGHARTIDITDGSGSVPVDTGFIVFNKKNYPNLTALFEHLNVPVARSSMSFGVTLNQGKFEYGTSGLKGFLGQPSNFFKPSFWRMFGDIRKFNRDAIDYCGKNENMTLGELLDGLNLSVHFRNAYLLPMTASIWSTPVSKMLDYPARSILTFLENHGLLTLFDQPQWFTVEGGSREYLKRLVKDFQGEHRTGVDIKSVNRQETGISVEFSDGVKEHFDRLVFACRPHQTLEMLSDASGVERGILSSFGSTTNRVMTHSDQSFMPTRRACWSSWTYMGNVAFQQDSGSPLSRDEVVSLTYWMNNLQPLKSTAPILVTMNPAKEADTELIQDTWETDHPVFDQPAIQAQKGLKEIQGVGNIYYCGAWTGYGFHEDGLRSGLEVAEQMDVELPWPLVNVDLGAV